MLPFFRFILIIILLFTHIPGKSQQNTGKLWHNQKRELRYRPDGEDFVIINGNKRFTRALYGTHTAFRVEAGDLPEFALYFPGMGGNIHFGLSTTKYSKWLNTARIITARYRPGSMLYEIKDSILGEGTLFLQLLALSNAEGFIMKVWTEKINSGVQLFSVFGGASNKKFSRNGDIGADPESSFYLKPENCVSNKYKIYKNKFILAFGNNDTLKCRKIEGIFPSQSELKLSDANYSNDILKLLNSTSEKYPVLIAETPLPTSEPIYIALQNVDSGLKLVPEKLPEIFNQSEHSRELIAKRVTISTPDPFINTFGGALSIAADGIWDETSFQHGAVAWRMPLNGWRGAYAATPLGWADRARKHFREYAKAQYTEPDSGPSVPDVQQNMARQEETEGVSLFTSGYISRNPGKKSKPHHYDMNLVFVDQLLNYLLWTGDTVFLREMWPLLTRHLAWEKRNFDKDGDGLYDAYACIWASDALQYSAGGVTHSSAYNYRANKIVSELAPMIKKNPLPFKTEADKILKSIQSKLWLKNDGWYAEYIDNMGLKLTHPNAGLWTIYHTIDSEIPNTFENYQSLRYIDNYIPHIPIIAKEVESGYYMLSTTNWMPYTWSLNNVVIAEMYHTALAYWQGDRSDEAFKLWKSNILESMYLGSSPGNFSQISFYDAFRGELYRDFADPIGMAARSLVEGLFGIKPNMFSGVLSINPGFPQSWDSASLKIPNIQFRYYRKDNLDKYTIIPAFGKPLELKLQLKSQKDGIKSIKVNGNKVLWNGLENAVDHPEIEISYHRSDTFKIEIEWDGSSPVKSPDIIKIIPADSVIVNTGNAEIAEIYDPQNILKNFATSTKKLRGITNAITGFKTFFIKVEQNQMSWWMPINIEMTNNRSCFPSADNDNKIIKQNVIYKTLDIKRFFNDKITNIFKNKYLYPRPDAPTLQLPVQGIGNWCYPNVTAEINDSGLRKKATVDGIIIIPDGTPFKIETDSSKNNILFTSQWHNFPSKVELPLSGKASHAYFMMAGTTNPMQSRITNGIIEILYSDGTSSVLELKNPENWWPIEQDYYIDGFAFDTNAPKPWRVHLKSGLITKDFDQYQSIKGFTNFAIDGGAATIIDMPLEPSKKLQKLVLKTLANDVIIGLMSVTFESYTSKK